MKSLKVNESNKDCVTTALYSLMNTKQELHKLIITQLIEMIYRLFYPGYNITKQFRLRYKECQQRKKFKYDYLMLVIQVAVTH